MNGMKSFLLFNDLEEPVNSLSDEEAGQLFKAIFEYQNGGLKRELSPRVMLAFSFIKQQLDRSTEHYEAICERNRINGMKGGRPAKPKEPTGLIDNPDNPGEPSGYSNNPDNPAQPKKPRRTLPNPNPDNNPKEKKKNLAPSVNMTEKEHMKLVEKFGADAVKGMVDKLSNYKMSKGKKYKSDYHAVLSWVVEELGAQPRTGQNKPRTEEPTAKCPNCGQGLFKDPRLERGELRCSNCDRIYIFDEFNALEEVTEYQEGKI